MKKRRNSKIPRKKKSRETGYFATEQATEMFQSRPFTVQQKTQQKSNPQDLMRSLQRSHSRGHNLSRLVYSSRQQLSPDPKIQAKLRGDRDLSSQPLLESSAPQQQIPSSPTAKEFRQKTNKGKLRQRGEIVKTIDRWLLEYSNLINREEIGPLEADKQQEFNKQEDFIIGNIDRLIGLWLKKYQPLRDSDNKENPELKESQIHDYLLNILNDIRNGVPINPAILPAPKNQNTSKTQKIAEKLKRSKPKTPEEKKEKLEKKTDKIENKYKKDLEGTPGVIFGSAIPSIINAIAPDIGDRSTVELQLTFPVAGTGLSVGGRFNLTAERKTKSEIKVNLEGMFHPSGNVGVGELFGELGAYSEIVASNSSNAGKLLDYSLYRLFRESPVVPRYVTNILWGDSSSKSGYLRAEQWGAGVEKSVFGETDDRGKGTKAAEKSYVESGGAIGTGGKAALPGMSHGGQVYGMVGKRYNKESLDKHKRFGRAEYQKKLGAQKDKGHRATREVIEVSGNFSNFNYSAKLRLEQLSNIKKKEGDLIKWEVDLKAQGRDLGSINGGIGEGIGLLSLAGVQGIRSLLPLLNQNKKLKLKKGKTAGRIGSAIDNSASGLHQAIAQTQDSLKDLGNGVSLDNHLGLGLQVKLGGEKATLKDESRKGKGEAHIELLNDHILKLLSGQVLQYEKAQRWASYKHETNGKWSELFTKDPKTLELGGKDTLAKGKNKAKNTNQEDPPPQLPQIDIGDNINIVSFGEELVDNFLGNNDSLTEDLENNRNS